MDVLGTARDSTLDARGEHERELRRLCSRLGAALRAPIWREVREEHAFDSSRGRVTLRDLLEGQGRLIVRHLLIGCGDADACDGCAELSQQVAAEALHVDGPGVKTVAVSLATPAEIDRYKRRMGWDLDWLSCSPRFEGAYRERAAAGGRVERDVRPGVSVFFRDPRGAVFHTLSCHASSVEVLNGVAEAWIDV